MSDTDVLELPTRQINLTPSRRVTFKTGGHVNVAPFDINGTVANTYTVMDAARLISVAVRVQTIRQGTPDEREAFMVTMGIVFDGFETGLIDEDGNTIPHRMFTENRYSQWVERVAPKRINGQQWVTERNLTHLAEVIGFLQEHGFTLIPNPELPQGSQRTTRDKYLLRPSERLDPTRVQQYGMPLESFDVSKSTNPDFKSGFNSFYSGLDEQIQRWVSASEEEDDSIKEQRQDELRGNIGFVSGVYYDEKRHRYFPRSVDVGSFNAYGQRVAFYDTSGPTVTVDELAADISAHDATSLQLPAMDTQDPNAFI